MAKFKTSISFVFLLLALIYWDEVASDSIPETKVIYKTAFSARQGKGDGKTYLCDRPIEQINVFKSCRALNSAHFNFPASQAECDCEMCMKKMKISCGKDKNWYTDKSKPCDKSSGCGACSKAQIPAQVYCSKNLWDGYTGERRYCKCRTNCRDVQLKCEVKRGKRGSWTETPKVRVCEDKEIHVEHNKYRHQVTTYANNYVNYTCDEGYEFQSGMISSYRCEDGMIGFAPRCILSPVTTTPKPTTTMASTTVTEPTTKPTPVIVITKEPTTITDPQTSPTTTLKTTQTPTTLKTTELLTTLKTSVLHTTQLKLTEPTPTELSNTPVKLNTVNESIAIETTTKTVESSTLPRTTETLKILTNLNETSDIPNTSVKPTPTTQPTPIKLSSIPLQSNTQHNTTIHVVLTSTTTDAPVTTTSQPTTEHRKDLAITTSETTPSKTDIPVTILEEGSLNPNEIITNFSISTTPKPNQQMTFEEQPDVHLSSSKPDVIVTNMAPNTPLARTAIGHENSTTKATKVQTTADNESSILTYTTILPEQIISDKPSEASPINDILIEGKSTTIEGSNVDFKESTPVITTEIPIHSENEHSSIAVDTGMKETLTPEVTDILYKKITTVEPIKIEESQSTEQHRTEHPHITSKLPLTTQKQPIMTEYPTTETEQPFVTSEQPIIIEHSTRTTDAPRTTIEQFKTTREQPRTSREQPRTTQEQPKIAKVPDTTPNITKTILDTSDKEETENINTSSNMIMIASSASVLLLALFVVILAYIVHVRKRKSVDMSYLNREKSWHRVDTLPLNKPKDFGISNTMIDMEECQPLKKKIDDETNFHQVIETREIKKTIS